ncbi:hypothetical protein WSM22_09570 [Cytophagales bacterium WSM2-2]|nr:hypothetical protein WSM22_09570 [Cytophagales bacterium WSM2-2]
MKTLVLAVLVLITAQTFAQSHEEGTRPDPAKSVHIFPNPAVEFLTLKFETPIAKDVKLEFHTIIGTMIELEHEALDEYEVKVKVKDLSPGYYLVGIHDSHSNSRAIHKFLKK